MARKRKQEEHENHERWLVSYADFITLLFAFFVVMYAVSSVNEGKYRILSESLVAAFRSPSKSLTPVQVGQVAKSPYTDQLDFRESPVAISLPDMPIPRHEEQSKRRPDAKEDKGHTAAAEASAEKLLKKISDEIENAMGEMIRKDLISVRRSKHWVEVEINTSILFPSGSASLSQEAMPVLKKLARILSGFPNAIHVEGFTDNVPISNMIFPSNWELSAGRAASVVHLFMQEGVDPRRMVAIGYGEYRPIADNRTAAGRRKNRRVVLVIQSTADSRQQLADGLRKPGPSKVAGGGGKPDPVAATVEPVTAAPLNPGALREPGKLPIIVPSIKLPFVPSGSAAQDPLKPEARAGRKPGQGAAP